MSHRSGRRPQPSKNVPVPYGLRRRLGSDMVQALLDDYRSGVPSTRLSVRYSVSKSALLNLLHEEGLATRKSGLTSAQILLASQLREDGLSYDVIGRRFGVYGSTVWRALRP